MKKRRKIGGRKNTEKQVATVIEATQQWVGGPQQAGCLEMDPKRSSAGVKVVVGSSE